MPKFALPPTGAKDVEMQDGSRYRGRGTLKHGRTIEVERSDHLRAMSSQESLQRMADFAGAHIDKPENVCPTCHFSAWPWQRSCPRCGTQLEAS